MRLYAPLVRRLQFTQEDHIRPTIQKDIFSVLFFNKITFSSLERLEWTPIFEHASIVHLLPSSLKAVVIGKLPDTIDRPPGVEAAVIDVFIGCLTSRCPNLRYLDLSEAQSPLSPTAFLAMLALQSVVEMAVKVPGQLVCDTLYLLGGRASLRGLSIQVASNDSIVLPDSPITFEGLERLRITMPLREMSRVLECIVCPSIKKIILDACRKTQANTARLIKAVVSSAGPQLSQLSIRASSTPGVDTASLIDALRPFSRLEHLRLWIGHHFLLNDIQLAQAFACWPLLQSIVLDDMLCQQRVAPDQVMLTLDGIMAAATLCPNIFCMSLLVDARNVPSVSTHQFVRGPEEDSLGFNPSHYSPIKNPDTVARYLRSCQVDMVLLNSDGGDSFLKKWQEVFQIKQLLDIAGGRYDELLAASPTGEISVGGLTVSRRRK